MTEDKHVLEEKVDFLVDLLTEEQYDQYSNWCDKHGYWVEGGA